MKRKHFRKVICTSGGKVSNSDAVAFIEGDFYAMGDANNNGRYILTTDEINGGDPVCVLVLNNTLYDYYVPENPEIHFYEC